jgi:hypothetical protein
LHTWKRAIPPSKTRQGWVRGFANNAEMFSTAAQGLIILLQMQNLEILLG